MEKRITLTQPCLAVVGQLLDKLNAVIGHSDTLPAGHEATDTGRRSDIPPCTLIRHDTGLYSWVPTALIQ